MCHSVICGLLGSIILFHIISRTAQFSKNVTEHDFFFDFLYDFRLQLFSFEEELSDMIKNIYWSSCKVSVIVVIF